MKNVIINYDGKAYPALETRNITAAKKAAGTYDTYRIKASCDGLISKLFIKPLSYWEDVIFAGTFSYDMTNDKITYLSKSDYDTKFLFVFKDFVNVLNDDDVLIVTSKRGRYIERYRIKIGALKMLIGDGLFKYGTYPVLKEGFEKLSTKVMRGKYAKK